MVRLLLEAKADPLHGQSAVDLVAKDETETGMLSVFISQPARTRVLSITSRALDACTPFQLSVIRHVVSTDQ